MNNLKVLAKRLSRSLEKRGLVQTLILGAKFAGSRAASLPRQLKTGPDDLPREGFDERYNVDTGGEIPLAALDIDSQNLLDGNQYQPIYEIDLPKLLAPFGSDYADYTFIDLGSGKGRAVLYALMMNFRKVIGVEFSEELNEVCRRNIDSFTGPRNAGDVEVLTMDAGLFQFPEKETIVLYIYNSFGASTMEQVIDNLRTSYETNNRRIIVLYMNPKDAEMWQDLDFLTQRVSDEDHVVLTTSEFD